AAARLEEGLCHEALWVTREGGAGKCGRGSPATILSVVIAGLDPAIHVAAPHCRVYGCHPAALITDGRVILGVKPEERRPRSAPSDGRVNITAIDGHASERDLLDIPVVGAAAAAEHAEVPKLAAQRAIAPAEIGRIANVEIGCRIELGVAARRCVRAQ